VEGEDAYVTFVTDLEGIAMSEVKTPPTLPFELSEVDLFGLLAIVSPVARLFQQPSVPLMARFVSYRRRRDQH
jgi:hypothetical protein